MGISGISFFNALASDNHLLLDELLHILQARLQVFPNGILTILSLFNLGCLFWNVYSKSISLLLALPTSSSCQHLLTTIRFNAV